jgi:hypothetical protein
MPSILTLDGSRRRRRRSRRDRGLGDPSVGDCKSVFNPRTKKSIQLCYVGKSRKHPTGWQFKRGTSR